MVKIEEAGEERYLFIKEAGDTVLHKLAKRAPWTRSELGSSMVKLLVEADPALRLEINTQSLIPLHSWAQYSSPVAGTGQSGFSNFGFQMRVLQALLVEEDINTASSCMIRSNTSKGTSSSTSTGDAPPGGTTSTGAAEAGTTETAAATGGSLMLSSTSAPAPAPSSSSSSTELTTLKKLENLSFRLAIREKRLLETVTKGLGMEKRTILHRMAMRALDWPSHRTSGSSSSCTPGYEQKLPINVSPETSQKLREE